MMSGTFWFWKMRQSSARQQPQPGAQGDLVAGELAGAGALATARDDAVEVPPAAAGEFQREAHRLAQ